MDINFQIENFASICWSDQLSDRTWDVKLMVLAIIKWVFGKL